MRSSKNKLPQSAPRLPGRRCSTVAGLRRWEPEAGVVCVKKLTQRAHMLRVEMLHDLLPAILPVDSFFKPACSVSAVAVVLLVLGLGAGSPLECT